MDETAQRQFVADMLAKGHSKDDIFAALDKIHSMAPAAPSGGHGRGDELFQPDPSPAPLLEGDIHGGAMPAGSHEQAAHDAVAQGRRAGLDADPVKGDWIAGTALAGQLGAGAGQLAREIPIIGRALQGGLASRVAGRAGVGAAEGGGAALASGARHPADIGLAMALGAGARQLTPPAAGPIQRLPATSEAGRATEAIGKVGGHPAMMRPAAGGMFDEPGYRALPPGDEGTARMAEGARRDITGSLESRDAANRGALGATESKVESELGDTLHSVDPIKEHIAKLRAENNNTPAGLPKDPSLEARLSQVETLLAPQEGDIPGATFGQLRGLQKSLKDEAQYGQPSTMENRPARMLEGAFGEQVKSLHPELAPAYERFGTEAQRLEEAKNALYGGRGTVRETDEIPLTNEERARGRLMRHGKDSSAAANQDVTLEHLALQDPGYAQHLDRLKARNAAEKLKFQGVSPGFGVDNGILRALTRNAGAATERFVRPLTGLGYRAGGPTSLTQNLPPLEALLLMQQEKPR